MKKNLLNTIKEHKGTILKRALLVAGSAIGIGLATAAFKSNDLEDYEDYDPEEDNFDTEDEDGFVNEESEECNESEEKEEEAE